MEKELRTLIAEYGVKGIYETLNKIMQDDLEALKKILEKSPQPVEDVKKEKKPVTKAKLPAPPKEEEIPEEIETEEQEDTIASLMQKAGKGAQIVIQKMDAIQSAKPTFSTLKEAKAWQKEQEEICRKKLVDQGIDPKSLLTKENLTKWIVEEKKGFSVIAREYVGLPELTVSSAAKEFGIQSPVLRGRPRKAT